MHAFSKDCKIAKQKELKKPKGPKNHSWELMNIDESSQGKEGPNACLGDVDAFHASVMQIKGIKYVDDAQNFSKIYI